jgi:hypothetical protein
MAALPVKESKSKGIGKLTLPAINWEAAMETIQTRSTSARTADCDPIVLREGHQVRLVFVPTLVDHPTEPKANVRGTFIYQKKARKHEWVDANTLSLTSVKSGEAYKLELSSEEVLIMRERLYELGKLQREHGIPSGRRHFVRMQSGLAEFLKLGSPDLQQLFNEHPRDALDALVKILRWASQSPDLRDAAQRISAIPASDLPNISSLLGLASLKAALAEWEENSTNSIEAFWQSLLSKHAAVLSQLFAYPVIVIEEKAYVGGRKINRRGGGEVDFLAKAAATDGLLLVEIKTPTTDLLGGAYRDGVRPLSADLNGAVAQVLHYRQTLMTEFNNLSVGSRNLTLGEPPCVVIAGTTSQLTNGDRRNNFELLRTRMNGVTIVTFDELFDRTRRSLGLMEDSSLA